MAKKVLMSMTAGFEARSQMVLENTLRQFGKRGEQMLGFATTDTLRQGEAQLKRVIGGEILLKKRKIGKSVEKKKTGKTDGMLSVLSGRTELLINFNRPRQIATGVTVGVRPGGREFKKSGFIRLGSGTGDKRVKQVFRRIPGTKKMRRRMIRGRLRYRMTEAVEALPGPTPFGVITGRPGLLESVIKQLGSIHTKVLLQKIESLFRETRRG